MPIHIYLLKINSKFKAYITALNCNNFQYFKKTGVRFLLGLLCILNFSSAQSQENLSQTLTLPIESNLEVTNESELLKTAKSLKSKNPKQSTVLANQALELATKKSNLLISSQSHIFLARFAEKSKQTDLALHHYLQASLIYKNLNDTHNQIITSTKYIEILLSDKRYDQANLFIDEFLPIVLEYEDEESLAITIIAKGDIFYSQKKYEQAIERYNESLQHLVGLDKEIQSRLGETYKKMAQSYKRLKDRENTALFYKKTLDVYTSLDNKKLMARTLNTLAEAERYLGDLVLALEYSMRGLKLHEQLNDPVGRNKALMGAGIIYRHIHRYEKSLEHIYEAHLHYKKQNDHVGIAKSSNQLGLLYTRLKEFDQARSFYQLTADLHDKNIDQNTLASALREIAVIDLNAGNYSQALAMATKAYNVYLREDDKLKASLTARIIGNIYRGQEEITNAITHYREALHLAKITKSKIYQIKSQTALAGVLINIDTDEALSLLNQSVALSMQTNNKSQALYAYQNLLKAEKSRNNYAAALRYAEEEIALTQLIQKENDENKLALAKASLHSHKLEIELKELREQTKFNQLELTKKNSEIELTKQAKIIAELELTKNRYANIALALLLAVCVLFVVFMYRRFIASNKRYQELDLLAARDHLTNSYNRRVLFERMNIDFASPTKLKDYCVILADIDHFKTINDTYGHSAGDSVLVGVASLLQSCVRQNDIVARFGGEEFCIVLHRVSPKQAMRLAETMRKKIENKHFDDINITCSFGVSSIDFQAKSPIDLIDQADLALYKSKSRGRNQVTLWEESFSQETNVMKLSCDNV